ncbi:hypothetical protein ACKWTF_003200 [Chironomus riparius]
MFAVVSGTLDDEVFVVPKSWIFEDDIKGICTFYPEKGKVKNLVMTSVEPENDWKVIAVSLLKDNIASYQLAHASMLTRTLYSNTASENEAKTKANRHKNAVKRYSSDEYDFNSFLSKKQRPSKAVTEISKDVKPKKVKSIQKPKLFVPKMDAKSSSNAASLPSSILPKKSSKPIVASSNEDMFATQQSDDYNSQEYRQSSSPKNHLSNKYGESSKGFTLRLSPHHSNVNISQIEKDQEVDLPGMNKDQFLILNQKLDDLTAVVMNLNSKFCKMTASANVDDEFSPEQIKSIKELNERENLLLKSPKDEDAKILKNNLIGYYYTKIRNRSSRGEDKYGLMASLCNLYFDKTLIPKLGWSTYDNRFVIKNFDGHFQLFFAIVNKNSPNIYTNVSEAAEQVQEYLRRFHETVNKAARELRRAQESNY